MKAILINSMERTVKSIEYKPKKNDITLLHKLIDCTTFGGTSFVYQQKDGTIFFDDEGVYKRPLRFFYVPILYPLPIAGNGIVLGLDYDSGNSVSVSESLEEELTSDDGNTVTFPNKEEVISIERKLMREAGTPAVVTS